MKGIWPNNFKGGLLFGGLATLLVALLMGAVKNDTPLIPMAILNTGENRAIPLSNTGRYQIASWEGDEGYGAFVIDTSTGITKVAYSSAKGPGGKTVNNLGKPFAQMP
jgi:hypothetical protein